MEPRFVLLAGSFGRTVARECRASKAEFLVHQDGVSVAKPLVKVSGATPLDHWLDLIGQSPRMLPLQDTVYVVTNSDHYPLYLDWARKVGLPETHVINNGSSVRDRSRPGDAADLALALDHIGEGACSVLFAANADYCLTPYMNFMRFVEAAIVTARPTIGMLDPCPVAMEAGAALLANRGGSCAAAAAQNFMSKILDRAGNTCKVERSSLAPGELPGAQLSVPLFAIPDAHFSAFRRAGQAASSWRSLERFMVDLNKSVPITGYELEAVFCTRSLRQVLFTDSFFSHYRNRKADLLKETENAIAVVATAGPEVLLGAEPDVATVEKMANWQAGLALDVRKEMKDFVIDYDEALISKSRFEGHDITLPRRFNETQKWSYGTRRAQHPCYTTENHAYGYKNPKKADMPMTWHGAKGEFTKTFAGMTRFGGLQAWTNMSKVHKTFDEYTHYR